jgi:hypothetical protein
MSAIMGVGFGGILLNRLNIEVSNIPRFLLKRICSPVVGGGKDPVHAM